MEKFIADKSAAGKRLDIAIGFLTNKYSRSLIKKFIQDNKVNINGKLMFKANYKVNENDEIEINVGDYDQKNEEKIIPENIGLDVVYEDEDLVAINKPAGMVVHPASGNWTGTVMNALLYKYNNLENVGNKIRSGLIHRLDKDTSGLLLIGKTNKGLWHYSRQFAERKVEKFYIAICYIKTSENLKVGQEIKVRNFIARGNKDRKKMSIYKDNLPPDARSAVSNIKIVSISDRYALLLIKPETGRMHQIRLHCSYIGLPILGDKVYGYKMEGRMFLHAYKLLISSPENKALTITAPFDSELKNFIKIYNLHLEI